MPISRYPRRGYPLAPQLLRRWLDVPVSVAFSRPLKGKRTLAELDATIWHVYSEKTCEALAGVVLKCIGAQRSSIAEAFDLRLPAIPTSIKLADLELETRTYNSLRKNGHSRNLSGMANISIGDVWRWKGFGVRCLVDLLTSIEGHAGDGQQQNGPPERVTMDPRLARIVRRIQRIPGISAITRHDLRFGKFVQAISPGAARLDEALQRVSSESVVQADGAIDRLQSLRKALMSASKLTLEEELAALGAALSPRDRTIVFRKIGMDGAGGCTLEEAGNGVGLTRERVRQLIKKFVGKLEGRGRPHMPTLDRVLATMVRMAPTPTGVVEKRLADEGLTGKPFRLEGVLEVAPMLGRRPALIIENVADARLLMKIGQEELSRNILSAARRTTEHWGIGRISDVVETVSETGDQPAPESVVRAVLLAQGDFEWLEESGGWFWLTSVARNRVVNQIRKMLSAVAAVPIAELRHGVSRPHRMQGFAPSRRVLLEICGRRAECILDGDLVRRSPSLREDEDLSPTEKIFAGVLRTLGGIAQRPMLEDAVLAAGVGRPMVWRILSYAAWISRYGTGVYGFRGLQVGPEVVESLIRKTEHARTNKDYGWKQEGKIWLAFELSEGVIDSGVFSVPAGIRAYVLGDFEMRDDNGVIIGRVRVKDNGSWGLLPLFSRRGGEPGDVLLLVFDPALKQVVARLGGEDLLDQAGESDTREKSNEPKAS
jgi:hypothetical protein